MSLAVNLPDDVREKLRQKAQALGVDVPTYAARVLEAEAQRPPLEEALRPVRDAFDKSGMSDDQLAETLEREKHEARAAKRGNPFRE